MEKQKLNLGCYDNILDGYVNLDIKKFNDKIDVIHNLEEFPYPFDDCIFEEVYARYILDHIDRNKLVNVFKEIYRILKPNGKLRILVSFKDRYMRDIDHKGGFCFTTFLKLSNERRYWHDSGIWKIKEMYGIPPRFSIGRLIPNFKINKGFRLRDYLSLYIGYLTNDIYVELIKVEM